MVSPESLFLCSFSRIAYLIMLSEHFADSTKLIDSNCLVSKLNLW